MNEGESLKIAANIKNNAHKWPKKTALIFQGNLYSYERLNKRANQLANWLLNAGFSRGDRVCIMAENCPEYIEAAIALAKIGVAWVPLNYRFLEGEVAFIAKDSAAKGFIVDYIRADLIQKTLSQIRGITQGQCLVIGERVPGGMRSFNKVLENSNTEEPASEVEENDLLYVGYTSGTTGIPKGALISHRNRVLSILIGAFHFGITKDDITLIISPLYHTATMLSVLRSLYLGGTIVLLPKFDALETLKAIERYRINFITMVPTTINRLMEIPQEQFSRFDLSSLKNLCSLASPLPTTTKEWILEKLPHVQLSEVYAATETGLITMLYPEDQRRKVRCVGQPIIGTEIRILDEQRRDLPQGQVGEIFIKNLTSIKSYLNLPKETSNCFAGDWITLEDMGKLDEEGYLYIVDRKKDMIKSGGVNIFPAEIEDTLMKHPAIQEVAVIGVPDREWGESIKALVVLKPGARGTEQEIRNFCRERIADFKVPKSVDFVSELPKSPFGKILKRVVRDEYWKDQALKI